MKDKNLTPETIYLIPSAETDYMWCDDPAPEDGIDESESIKYIRADLIRAQDDWVSVDAIALRDVLAALNGQSYQIRELQVIDNLPTNEGPIAKLTRQFNEWVESEYLYGQSDGRL